MSDSTSIFDYSADNIVYTTNKKFMFSYYFISSKGDTFLLDNEGYALTPVVDTTNTTLVEVGFGVSEANTKNLGRDYKQSRLEYYYTRYDSRQVWPKEASGLVENEKNIWIHPFRSPKYFKMLNLNAYPFVKFPLEIDKEWDWTLNVGNMFSDRAWKLWDGNTPRYHKYKVIDKRSFKTRHLGFRNVWVLRSKTSGDLGPTQLDSYFDEELGFVKLHYFNIDGSQFVFDLRSINE